MAYVPVLDEVLSAWTTPERFATFAHVVDRATVSNKGKTPHIAFETVWVSNGHPFDYLKASAVLDADRRTVGEVEILRLNDDEGAWQIVALPTEHEGVFHLAGGIPTTHPRWQKLVRWVERARDLSRCFLNHRDFRAIGEQLQEFGEVEVVHVTGRSNVDQSSYFRGFPTVSGALRPTPEDLIGEFERNSAYVRSWTLRLEGELHFHLRRVAGATFYSGRFRLFTDQVLDPLAAAAADRRALLTGRQRKRAVPVVPLTIMLDTDVFNTREDTGMLVELAQSMTDMSMAVFHRNPYLHFVLTDENDGSNFDVMVTVPNAVDVYPGFRASPASLARVTGRIAEAFGAERIKQADPRPKVSLDELVGV
ncbi:MAG: hypothetical protein ACOX61_01160 [Brooklawnia sp.]